MPDDYRSKMLKRTNVRTTDKFMFFFNSEGRPLLSGIFVQKINLGLLHKSN